MIYKKKLNGFRWLACAVPQDKANVFNITNRKPPQGICRLAKGKRQEHKSSVFLYSVGKYCSRKVRQWQDPMKANVTVNKLVLRLDEA